MSSGHLATPMTLDDWRAEAFRQQAEVIRLREALEQIAKTAPTTWAVGVARAALSEGEKP